MFLKTITATAFAIGMSTAAFAQATAPDTWDQTTSDAFFSDSATGTLRSQDEIQANWGTLSDEQQAAVRAHCATMAADAGAGMTDDTATGAITDDPAAGATADDTAGVTGDDATTGVPAGDQFASMSELCSWVETQ